MEIWWIRHGESLWNREGRRQGQQDSPLTPQGLLQAEHLARALDGWEFDAVFSSDLDRARATAAAALPAAEPRLDRRLRELDMGSFEGTLWAELEPERQAALDWFWEAPFERPMGGGESLADLTSRVVAWRGELPSEGRVAAFTHGGVIRCALWHIVGAPRRVDYSIRLDNGSITRVSYRGGRAEIVGVNDTSHLVNGVRPSGWDSEL